MNFEQLIDYFAIFGGTGQTIEFDYFDILFELIETKFISDFAFFQSLITPSYLLESPYREVLMAIARGDGKIYSVLRKANLSETLGEHIVKDLTDLGVIRLETSSELVFSASKKYRIQDKLRFNMPYYRFWFGFVEPFRNSIIKGDITRFVEYFKAHYERLRSLIFEQLSNELLCEYFESLKINIVFSGSYWDRDNEFDIVAVTDKKEMIIAECKYKDRKVCKNELTKLKSKALQLGFPAAYYVLFSKQGFSGELLGAKDKNLLLFDLQDFQKWIMHV
ncbi:MAG: DUF234 domain-containing protein [Sulfurovaceae bacterium]|nr:DUF234 domain-containing protein [Sulfurovaceae bacterium]